MGSFRERWRWLVLALAWCATWSVPAAAQVPGPLPDACPGPCPQSERDPAKSLCPDEHDFYLTPPRCPWYVVGDGLAIRRDAAGHFHAATLNNPYSVALSTADLDDRFSGGARVLVGHTINDCLQVEGVYFTLGEWDEARAIRNMTENDIGGQGNLFSPFTDFGNPPVVGLDYNRFASIHYVSSLDNVELNVRRAMPMPAGKLTTSILFGVRYLDIPERFEYATEAASGGFPGGSIATNEVRVDTDNVLVGPQIGALFEFYAENRWWVNFEIKGALCNNRAGQATEYRNATDGFETVSFGSRKDDSTAFVGDLALTFVYRWSPFLTTRLGYQAIWVDGLALASENFNRDVHILTDGPAQLVTEGNVVYHGPHAGIMLSW